MIEVRYEGVRILIPEGKEEELLNHLDGKWFSFNGTQEEKERRERKMDAILAKRK
jgi:hypothetical protein